MQQEVSIALSGCGGYGRNYLRQLLDPPAGARFRVTGLIDPRPPEGPDMDQARGRGWPLFKDLPDFFAAAKADLVILATPIHLHAPQTIMALEHGANVVCEKPLATTYQDALSMAAAEKQAGKFVAIGYQSSFSPAFQELKRDIRAGVLGRPLRLKTIYLWPRTAAYYRRNNWAGALRNAAGDWILDSPVNNATAHFLHNMFYILGKETDNAAVPLELQAECYRANPVENYDTAMLRCRTADNVEIMFFSTHAVPANAGPILSYEFENARVGYFSAAPGRLIARLQDGSSKDYGVPTGELRKSFWRLVESVHTGERPVCGIAAASSHTLCVNGVQESVPVPVSFPEDLVNRDDQGVTWVQGLMATMIAGYDQWQLPGELGGIPWASQGRVIDLSNYQHFPDRQ